jgi:hypothetical protein
MAPKTPVKTGRTATTVNKAPSKPKKTYTTSGGAQQYVRGNTSKERNDNLQKAAISAIKQPKFNTTLHKSLLAADMAEASRSLSKTIGPKSAKTSSTVRMFDDMERDSMDRAKAARKKP